MSDSRWQQLAESQWNHRAKSWNESSKTMWETGSRKEIMGFFLRTVAQGETVLDIGCAGGYSTNKLYDAGMQVQGLDLSEEMIQTAKRMYPHISFQKGDVSALPYSDGTFDNMLAINVLEWVEVPVVAIQELHRTLKAGGKLCIGVLGPTAGPRQHAFGRLYGEKVMMNSMQPWEFEMLAIENGFKVTSGMAVEKKWGMKDMEHLPINAQQALSFMWVFMLEKKKGDEA